MTTTTNSFLAEKRKIWKKEDYCISNVENEDEFWLEYHVCKDKAENVYLAVISAGLIPVLMILSMICLVLTFGLLYKEQKEKLFGSVES